jgi:hypothetical protein
MGFRVHSRNSEDTAGCETAGRTAMALNECLSAIHQVADRPSRGTMSLGGDIVSAVL